MSIPEIRQGESSGLGSAPIPGGKGLSLVDIRSEGVGCFYVLSSPSFYLPYPTYHVVAFFVRIVRVM